MGVDEPDLAALTAPELLQARHDLLSFACGDADVDAWLRQHARLYQALGASRTWVVAEKDRVAGFYTISAGGIEAGEAPARLRRPAPDPIPMTVIGRLAVDRRWQKRRLGALLLRDAILRTSEAAAMIGIRGVFAHAESVDGRRFYERWGFRASIGQPMTMVVSLLDAKAAAQTAG